MCEGIPDDEGPPAREGTFAHDIAEQALTGALDRAEDYIGVMSDGDEFEWDAARAEALQLYLDFVNEHTMMHDEVKVEQRVVFSDDNWGTSDIVAWTEDTLDIIDLKFGFSYVSAKKNEQMMDYAAAALESIEGLPDTLTTVRMTIVQPRHHDEDDRIRTATMTIGEIRMWARKVLEPGIAATFDPKARLVPGEHCQYCPAAKTGKCPAIQDQALSAATEVFPDADVEQAPLTPPDPQSLSAERISAVLKAAPLLRKWLDNVESFANTQAKGGLKVPGYKLVGTLGNRAWKNEENAKKVLAQHGVNAVVERTMSPNQAKQALTEGTGKEKQAIIDALCERPTGEKLVADDDPRPAIGRADAFDEVPE